MILITPIPLKKLYFPMAVLICKLIFLNTPDHFEDGFIFFFDPQNMDVDTLIVPLSVILTEIQLLIHFLVMAGLIRIAY